MYRPQFPMRAAPEGFAWHPVVYQFDQFNVPAFANISLAPGQETGHIPLPLDHDAPFVLLGAKMSDVGLGVLLTDPWSNQLMDDYVSPNLYASDLEVTALEGPGIEVPAGAIFQVRLRRAL